MPPRGEANSPVREQTGPLREDLQLCHYATHRVSFQVQEVE